MGRLSIRSGVGAFAVLAAGLLSGCLSPVSDSSIALIAADSTSSSSSVEPSESGDLYLRVSTAWDQTPTTFDTQVDCSIPVGSATTTTACSVAIPQAQLFFSGIQFTVGTSDAAALGCSILIFRPYYYQVNNSALTVLPWADSGSTIDCSGATTAPPVNCYDGVATTIVPSFPTYAGVYTETSVGSEATYSASSSNSLGGRSTNRFTTDDLATPAVAIPSVYLANTMQFYSVECRDVYYNLLKQITLTVSSSPELSPADPRLPNSVFPGWE